MTHETAPMRLVGLRYVPEEGAPQLILKASGEQAEELLRARRRAADAPPVVRDAALVEELYRLPIDGHIRPELYRAVAIVLAHVLDVEQKLKEASARE